MGYSRQSLIKQLAALLHAVNGVNARELVFVAEIDVFSIALTFALLGR